MLYTHIHVSWRRERIAVKNVYAEVAVAHRYVRAVIATKTLVRNLLKAQLSMKLRSRGERKTRVEMRGTATMKM